MLSLQHKNCMGCRMKPVLRAKRFDNKLMLINGEAGTVFHGLRFFFLLGREKDLFTKLIFHCLLLIAKNV